jgi:hypothetical protein
MEEPPFRPEFFARLDEDPDEAFYTMPRKVVHIDEAAITASPAMAWCLTC